MNRKSFGKKSVVTLTSALAVAFMLNVKAFDADWFVDCQSPSYTVQPAQSQICEKAMIDSVSWFDWLGRKSRSYQFHFLDLLELLYSDDSEESDHFSASPTSAF